MATAGAAVTCIASDDMRASISESQPERADVAEDIAAAVAFRSGQDGGFVTGTDLLVDGGATAVRRWPAQSR